MQHSFFKLFSSLFIVFALLSFGGFALHGQKLPGHIPKEQSPISTASPLPNNKQVILLIDSAIALSQQDPDAALTLLHKVVKAALHHGSDIRKLISLVSKCWR
jgi:predicted sugar kinase